MPYTKTDLLKLLDDVIWMVDGEPCPRNCPCVVHWQQRERIGEALKGLWWYPRPRSRINTVSFETGPLGDPLCDPDCPCRSHKRLTPQERMAEGGRKRWNGRQSPEER